MRASHAGVYAEGVRPRALLAGIPFNVVLHHQASSCLVVSCLVPACQPRQPRQLGQGWHAHGVATTGGAPRHPPCTWPPATGRGLPRAQRSHPAGTHSLERSPSPPCACRLGASGRRRDAPAGGRRPPARRLGASTGAGQRVARLLTLCPPITCPSSLLVCAADPPHQTRRSVPHHII